MVELINHGIPNIVCIQSFACLPNPVVGKGVLYLNEKPLGVSDISILLELRSENHPAGTLELAPATCTFIVI